MPPSTHRIGRRRLGSALTIAIIATAVVEKWSKLGRRPSWHLGAVVRSAETGEVDERASGPGASAYSSRC
jgi:hypothetical protein